MLGAHYPHVTVATILDNAHRDQLHQHLVLWEKGKSSTKFLQTPPLSAVGAVLPHDESKGSEVS